MIRTSLALAAALAALPVQAQVYKCVVGGRTVYSQEPCPSGAASTTINRNAPSAPAPGASGGAAGPKNTAEQEQAFRKRQQEQQQAAKKDGQKQAEAQERQQNCNTARSQLAQYESGARVTRYNSSGERVYLDDTELQQEKARAQSLVRQWCPS
jgi:uncharacterized protein DUF4124